MLTTSNFISLGTNQWSVYIIVGVPIIVIVLATAIILVIIVIICELISFPGHVCIEFFIVIDLVRANRKKKSRVKPVCYPVMNLL